MTQTLFVITAMIMILDHLIGKWSQYSNTFLFSYDLIPQILRKYGLGYYIQKYQDITSSLWPKMPDILMRPGLNYRLVTEQCEFYDYFHQFFFFFCVESKRHAFMTYFMQMIASSAISK